MGFMSTREMRPIAKFKTLCLIFSPLALLVSQAVPLPTLPCGELPNSEVVTNVALNVDYGRLENLTFSLELNASASNSLLRSMHSIPAITRSFSFV